MSVKKSLLYLAGIILMIHAFVPHTHGTNSRSMQQITEADNYFSLYNYLQLSLQFNPGPCHLDHFQNQSSPNFHFDLICEPVSILIPEVPVIDLFYDQPQDFLNIVYSSAHTESYTHRGPPQLI